MPMRLSCADYTWPSVPHVLALDLIRSLGFDGVDIGYFAGRTHLRPEDTEDARPFWAGRLRERCDARDLRIADVFAQTSDFEDRAVNHPDPTQRASSLRFFESAVEFARLAGSPGITVLPGVVFGGEDQHAALERSAAELRHRVKLAGELGLRLSVEPHVESVIDTPERAGLLVQLVPGLRLTLDYGHFVFGGATDDDIEPLLAATGHVQCRGAAPGILQADAEHNTIDFPRMVRRLAAIGYEGFVATEDVWAQWHDCNRVDNLTETVALRDVLRLAVAGAEQAG